jgi:hypothetical protein
MNQEINLLKDKYELLKQPLYTQIASAAIGKKVDSSLYKPAGSESNAISGSVIPAALPEYWIKVFAKSGLLEEEKDFEAISKLS